MDIKPLILGLDRMAQDKKSEMDETPTGCDSRHGIVEQYVILISARNLLRDGVILSKDEMGKIEDVLGPAADDILAEIFSDDEEPDDGHLHSSPHRTEDEVS